MNRSRIRYFVVALLAPVVLVVPVVLTGAALAAPPAPAGPAPDDDPARLCAWFDTLGYPDLARARFIRVSTGSWRQRGDEPAEPIYSYGFLISDDEATFSGFSLSSLQTRELEKTPPGTDETDRVGFDDYNLADYIDERLKPWSPGGTPSDELKAGRNTHPLGECGQLVLLARAAHARGLAGHAARLMEVIARLPKPVWHQGVLPRSTRQRIVDDLAFAETWEAIDVLRNQPDVSRTEVLTRFQHIASLYPDFARHEEIARAVAGLRRQVREDEVHAAAPATVYATPLDRRPKSEQIAELIYRLRDLDESYYARGYHHDADGTSTNAVLTLAAFGPDAVPRLLAAMDDDAFIRARESFVDAYELAWPPTVGEAAETAIGFVAGRPFQPEGPKRYSLSPAEQWSEKKRLVRAWYDDLEARGLKAVLIQAVRSGEDHAWQQACRLAKLYPDDAAAPIIEAARKCGNSLDRRLLIGPLAKIPGDAVRPFLLDEVRAGLDLDTSISAAGILRRRGDDAWLPILIDRWNELPSAVAVDPDDDYSKLRNLKAFAEFLVRSGQPRAVRTLTASMRRRPIDVRFDVVSESSRQLRYLLAGKYQQPYAAGFEDALFELLIAALDDDRERSAGIFFPTKGLPRVGDAAGAEFSMINPKKYAFELRDDQAARDRALESIRDTARRAQGLPPRNPGPRAPTTVTPDS